MSEHRKPDDPLYLKHKREERDVYKELRAAIPRPAGIGGLQDAKKALQHPASHPASLTLRVTAAAPFTCLPPCAAHLCCANLRCL